MPLVVVEAAFQHKAKTRLPWIRSMMRVMFVPTPQYREREQ